MPTRGGQQAMKQRTSPSRFLSKISDSQTIGLALSPARRGVEAMLGFAFRRSSDIELELGFRAENKSIMGLFGLGIVQVFVL